MAVCDDNGNVVDLNCSGQDTEGMYMEPYSQLMCREVWPCRLMCLRASYLTECAKWHSTCVCDSAECCGPIG